MKMNDVDVNKEIIEIKRELEINKKLITELLEAQKEHEKVIDDLRYSISYLLNGFLDKIKPQK